MSVLLFDKPLDWVLNAKETSEYKSDETTKHIELVRDYNSPNSLDHTKSQVSNPTPDDMILQFVIDKCFSYYLTGEFKLSTKAEINMDFICMAGTLEKQALSTINRKAPAMFPPRVYDRDPYTDRILIYRTRGENFNKLRQAYNESSAQAIIYQENGEEREIYVTTNV